MSLKRFYPLFLFCYLLTLASIVSAESDTLITYLDRGLSLRITKTPALAIDIKANNLKKAEVFVVPNPTRLVIDLFGIKKGSRSKPLINNNSYFSNMRFGIHKDKLRIVLDCKISSLPEFTTATDNGTVSISFSSPPPHLRQVNSTSTSASPTLTPTIQVISTSAPTATVTTAPTYTPVPSLTPTLKPTLTPTTKVISTSTPTLAPESTPTQTPQPTATKEEPIAPSVTPATKIITPPIQLKNIDGLLLNQIAFEYDKNSSPIIKLSLNHKPKIKLVKKTSTEYGLVVDEAKLWKPFLGLVRYPPHDFLGFNYVKADESDSGLSITIGVSEKTKILAITSQNDIIIRVR